MSDIFMLASRRGLTFQSVQGRLSVTDLWNIPLRTSRSNKASIENVGAAILAKQAELNKLNEASILGGTTASPEKATVDLQVAILKEIARIRQIENAKATEAKANASEKARLDTLIREREGTELPLEELRKQREALGA